MAVLSKAKSRSVLGIETSGNGRSPRREALDAQPPWPLQEALCGKSGYLSPLTQTQLAPVIWAIIIGLVALFLTKVFYSPILVSSMLLLMHSWDGLTSGRVYRWGHHLWQQDSTAPAKQTLFQRGDCGVQVVFSVKLPPAPMALQAAAVAVVVLAGLGLYLMWRVTTTDPGFLPRGRGASSGSGKSPPINGGTGRLSSKDGSQYRCPEHHLRQQLAACLLPNARRRVMCGLTR